jgi:hypothetical protein
VLISADSTASTADLCADLREKLVHFLQREHPEALPCTRSETVAPPARATQEPPVLRASANR